MHYAYLSVSHRWLIVAIRREYFIEGCSILERVAQEIFRFISWNFSSWIFEALVTSLGKFPSNFRTVMSEPCYRNTLRNSYLETAVSCPLSITKPAVIKCLDRASASGKEKLRNQYGNLFISIVCKSVLNEKRKRISVPEKCFWRSIIP